MKCFDPMIQFNDDHEENHENIDYEDIKEDRINQNALFRMPCPC